MQAKAWKYIHAVNYLKMSTNFSLATITTYSIRIQCIIGICIHIITIPHVSVLMCRPQANFPLIITNSLQIISQIYNNIHTIHDAKYTI